MDPYLAEINIFAGTFAPQGWALCNGQTMSIANNTALFSLIGTMYGGDGQTTFILPDLRGRVPVGTGQGAGLPTVNLGERAGTEGLNLTVANLPMHTHVPTTVVSTNAGTGSTNAPAGAYWGNANVNVYSKVTDGTLMNAKAVQITSTSAVAGASKPVSNVQPYLAMNYIIAVEGIYPSRN
jgi:microcystin-dependent protein